MKNIIENLRIPYLSCLKSSEHDGELLNNICIDQDCKQQELICSICEMESHQNHKTVSLKYFLSKIQKSQDVFEASCDVDDLLLFINSSQQNSQQIIQNFQINVQNMIETTLQNSTKFYEKLKQNIKFKFKSNQTPNKMIIDFICNGKYQDPNQLQSDMQGLLNSINISEDFEIEQKANLSEIKEDLQGKLVSLGTKLKDNQDQLEQLLVGFQSYIFDEKQMMNYQKTGNFKFSDILKASSITLTQENLMATQTSQSSSAYVLCDEKLVQSKIQTFALKIIQYQTWLSIGLAYKKLNEASQYKYQGSNLTGKTGHGVYLIATNGYSYSHLKADFNYKKLCFSYGNNDIIYIECNSKENKVKFRKNDPKNGELFELDYEFIEGDELVPCACLYYTQSQVELINKISY